jgi:hypothetical protein
MAVFSRGTVGVRQLVPQDQLKYRQQSIAVSLTPSQRGVERPEHSLGPIGAQSFALQASDNSALPLDVLDAALDALFGARKLALEGGAIHLLQLPGLKVGDRQSVLREG